MRRLKNVELVGKTRLIPGVGHVVMAAEMHEYVAEACDAAGLDWFEAGVLAETSDRSDRTDNTGELDTGDTGEGDTSNENEDISDENADGADATGDSEEKASEDAGKTQSTPNVQNGRKRK